MHKISNLLILLWIIWLTDDLQLSNSRGVACNGIIYSKILLRNVNLRIADTVFILFEKCYFHLRIDFKDI